MSKINGFRGKVSFVYVNIKKYIKDMNNIRFEIIITIYKTNDVFIIKKRIQNHK